MNKSLSKPKIGVIGAMEPEVSLLKESMDVKLTKTVAAMNFYEGKIGDTDCVVVQCGMGKVNAALCAHTLIHVFGCTAIINSGVAGSLDNDMDIGDFVLSTEASQHDFDVTPIGFKKGEIPYTGLTAFKADEKLLALAREALKGDCPEAKVFEGRVCSGDQFIIHEDKKQNIVDNFHGLCCEMEGAAIAQACYLSNVPFVIIRCISDKPDGSEIMNFEEFSRQAAQSGSKVVKTMLSHLE